MKLSRFVVRALPAISIVLLSLALLPQLERTAQAQQSATGPLVRLIANGASNVVLISTTEIMAEDAKLANTAPEVTRAAENNRRKLRDSVLDLAAILKKMSGATVEVVTAAPAASDKRIPILIGSPAQAKFGPVKKTYPYLQGFRVVVTPQAIGLFGENDESSSYAIYEVLHRLGCRWYMPSEMGEEIPQLKTIELPAMDYAGTPGTWYRGIWYADAAFKRRNRMGGFGIAAGHALEYYVTAEQREKNPDWRAVIKGQPHRVRLKWSHPGVQQAVADAILAKLDAQYVSSISLSPEDGSTFDESDDLKWDAGDYDAVMDGPSITDRYIKFCNIVAEKVTKKYPDVKLGFLAYVQYTQAPLREKLHPNLVPMFAPINYCRAHAMTDNCQSRQHVKKILEGWAKATNTISYYNYMFNLAEYSVPYPMIHQMKEELPIMFANNVKYWQPEGMSNNDQALPGIYLTIRKSWNPAEDSDAILNEFFTRFYGKAEPAMRKYWTLFDDQWIKVDEHAGGGWDYMRRFTPEFMKSARDAMDDALQTATTITEFKRVQMHDANLRQFERWMQMLRDLQAGRLAGLGPMSQKWIDSQSHLGDQYFNQYAFSKAWQQDITVAGRWFRLFYEPAYLDATRITLSNTVLQPVLKNFKYLADKERTGEERGLFNVDFNDKEWKTTEVGVDTWYALGYANYYGPMWYRATIPKLAAIPEGKKVYLWVSRTDGDAKVWVNGKHIPYVNEKGEVQDEFKNGYGKPISFDITGAIKPGAANQITIRGTHVFVNELGTGGLLGPVVLYREK